MPASYQNLRKSRNSGPILEFATDSQTHVLISYMAGYRGHSGMLFLESLFLSKCAYFGGRRVLFSVHTSQYLDALCDDL
jgi:hypothetical protein